MLSEPNADREFAVVGGAEVRAALNGAEREVVDVVERTYLAHRAGTTTNPPSYFLRFPDRSADRIIALPASIRGEHAVDGIKWISSVPGNIDRGLPRASAVTILNDTVSGVPIACIESSVISATRTAASAALAARLLGAGRPAPRTLGVVGAGPIARTIVQFLHATGCAFDRILVHDQRGDRADRFAAAFGPRAVPAPLRETVSGSDVIVLATTAPRPYIEDPAWFTHGPIVLNVSLRDLAVPLILESQNVVDDIDHVLKADTSVHLAQQSKGAIDYIHGTIADIAAGSLEPDPKRTIVFSPFGLGVLDLAVSRFVLERIRASGELRIVDDFFDDASVATAH